MGGLGLNDHDPVVVTGLGILSALGDSPDKVLEQMLAGASGIGSVSRFAHDKFLAHIAGEIGQEELSKLAILDKEDMDICAKYAVVAIQQALADANLEPDECLEIGLALGTCNGGIHALEEQQRLEQLDPVVTRNYPFYRQTDAAAEYLQLGGPVVTTNTACTASGGAIGFAYDLIQAGAVDMMVAGGSDPLSQVVYAGFNALRALAGEPCTPFGQRRGLTLGEGAGFIVLERWSHAKARGARVYAVVDGYGLSCDGYHETATHPEGDGVRRAMVTAMRTSGIDVNEIGYVNSHGTGTEANDAPEMRGIRSALGEEAFLRMPVSSSKSYFGHALGAAAVIEYISTLKALHAKRLPAILGVQQVRPECTEARLVLDDMPPTDVSGFLSSNSAFGGHNFCIASRLMTDAFSPDDELQHSKVDTHQLRRSVAVVGLGTVIGHQAAAGTLASLPYYSEAGKCEFSLRQFEPTLYERRMNRLTQFAVGATKLALLDGNWSTEDIDGNEVGIYFGTARGSLESTTKYLSSTFEKGPEYASSIHFPQMVLNSTMGKISEKLGLRGFSNSLSTGGTDGLMALIQGYQSLTSGRQSVCLVAAGDEFSALSSEIDRAMGLAEQPVKLMEGSCAVALSVAEEHERENGYAQMIGYGTRYGTKGTRTMALQQSIAHCLSMAGIGSDAVGQVLWDCPGSTEEISAYASKLSALLPLASRMRMTEVLGYAESFSGLLTLSLAADWLRFGEKSALAASSLALQLAPKAEYCLVISISLYGNHAAVLLERFDNHSSVG